MLRLERALFLIFERSDSLLYKSQEKIKNPNRSRAPGYFLTSNCVSSRSRAAGYEPSSRNQTTVTLTVSVSVAPSLSVTVNVTVYVSAAVYW